MVYNNCLARGGGEGANKLPKEEGRVEKKARAACPWGGLKLGTTVC